MNLQTFGESIANNTGRNIEFQFPAGDTLEPHFHITEVGRVMKDFVDCGGTRRKNETCVLQTLVGNDTDHRLTTDKLSAIIDKASVLGIDSKAPVELEIQRETVAIFQVGDCTIDEEKVSFRLSAKQTECLAPDRCGIELSVIGDDCSGPDCC